MKPVFPDARYQSKLFPPGGPFAPHRCAICGGQFEVGQQFYSYGQGQVVHTKCRFQKDAHGIKGAHDLRALRLSTSDARFLVV